VNQLKELDALDRIHEVMDELPQTRKDLGYPPLVTPTSQIVGIQAVMNVLFGRYNKVTAETQGLAYGLYGKTPAPMDLEVQKLILKGYERGDTPTTGRPGDILEPEWDKAVADTKGIAKDEGDILISALYPTTGMRFLKWKYGLEPIPADVKGKTLEQIALEDEVYTKIKQKKLFAKVKDYLDSLEQAAPEKGSGLRSFNVFVDNQYYQVEVECTSGAPVITGVAPMAAAPRPAAAPAAPAAAPRPAAAAPAGAALAAGDIPLKAPMPGMIISYSVKVGDKVNNGDLICVLEAMKMQNSLPAPASGVVKAINFEPGASVAKDATIMVIGK
jgi:biotin carboxyl carrier protein